MEYPGAKFTRPLRRALLIIFVVAFGVIAPIVILSTTGYRYDWKNGLLRETGSISVDILPKDTSVYLNGLKLKDTMPIRLNSITPGKYTVRLSASGYYDWQKEIEVKNKQTTYLKEIELLKKNKPELLLKGKIGPVALSDDGRYLLYVSKEKNRTKIWLRETRATVDALILDIARDTEVDLRWGKNINYFTVGNATPPYRYLLIARADNPDKKVDLVKIAGEAIRKFQWRETGDPVLFYSTFSSIKSFSPSTMQQAVIAPNRYVDWFMESGSLWTLELATTTKKLRVVRDTLGFKSNIADLEAPNSLYSWRILMAVNGAVLVKDSNTANVTLLSPDKKFNFGGENFTISKYNNWWLVWTPWELWTYTNGEEPYLLNRSAEKLQGVAPLDKYNTLALIWERKVVALFPYYLIEHDLIEGKVTSLAADAENRTLFYTTEAGLWKLGY